MKIPAVIKTPKFWIFFLVTALIFESLGDWLSKRDELLQASKLWLHSQDQIIVEIGSIRKIDVKESLYFQGDSSQAPYNRYTLLLDGESSDAVAVVRATKDDNEGKQLELISLRILKN